MKNTILDKLLNQPKSIKYVFGVIAADERDEAGQNFSGVTQIKVFANEAKDAIAKAKKIAPEKKYYVVRDVSELNCDGCNQEQYMSEMLKMLKKHNES